MADERDEIRSRIDIVELVGREIHLTQKGKTWKGLCPFHQDKNPSFDVNRQTGRYKCWSCGEAGDIFNWVMKRQNVDFAEAIRTLAKEAGVTLAKGGTPVLPSVRQAQEAAMDAALIFFQDHLAKNSVAKEYCERRGLDAETLKTWEIGYAPEVGDALATHLKKQGLSLSDCKALFLVDQDANGGYFDKFRGRLMFPIRDEKGVLVAFGGRLLGDGHPKYINSSDTALYRKSKVLYGMNRARHTFGKERRAVLVEGYLDVIACHRAGVTSALASLGTALSEDHAKLLKRWVDEVVILYDSDAAGQKAADRAVGILSAEGLRVRVALMPAGEDPDTLLRNAGPAAVQQSVETGLSPLDYKMQALELRLDPKTSEEFWNIAVALLAEAPTEMELDRHLLKLAHLYPGFSDVLKSEKALRREINKIRRQAQGAKSRQTPDVSLSQPRQLRSQLSTAEMIIFLAFLSVEFRSSGWLFARSSQLFASGLAAQISQEISNAFPNAAPEGEPALWLHRIEDEELRQTMSDMLLDFRAANLTEARITDTVERLNRGFEERKMAELRRSERDSQKSNEYLMRLRKHKPDTRVSPQGNDNLFG